MDKDKTVILGAGPCGIGAAWYLYKKGYSNWAIYERNPHVGGLSASFRDEKDFTWDIGGHVLFSHQKEFGEFLDEALDKKYLLHKRDSWIRIFDSWIPYPFQNNIHYLPKEKFELCLRGLSKRSRKDLKAKNFKQWLTANFGRSIARYFMIPLNKKMWSYPLEKMSTEWIAERISPINLEEIKKNASNRDKISNNWGPNSNFIYPVYGGVGEVFRRAAARFKDKLKLGYQACKIDLDSKKIFFKNGEEKRYDILINTSSIRNLVNMSYPKNRQLIKLAERLKYNGIIIIGIGLRRKREDRRSWMYFPEQKYPFFRVTNLSNYSVHNVPNGDVQRYSSLLTEIIFPKRGTVNKKSLIRETINSLIDTGLLLESDRELIESIFCFEAEYAYPIPTLDRDRTLDKIDGFLKRYNVFSRGRFGSFRYERGNMDDCFMQGYAVAKQIVDQ